LEVVAIRGNIDTRLDKLADPEYNLDAIVLAAAGLERMGWQDQITEYLDSKRMLPAASQGALAIEAREDDQQIKELLQSIDDQETRYQLQAERGFLEELDGDCKVPIGALAEINGSEIRLDGLVASLDGDVLLRDQICGSVDQSKQLGVRLAERLLEQGAGKILRAVRQGTDN
ncbi:MAG: hydroxymethylbilane synthase, partial [Bacillota bacterium]